MNNFTEELPLKEGMYVQKVNHYFSVFSTEKGMGIIKYLCGSTDIIKQGNKVTITPETKPKQADQRYDQFYRTFFRNDSKTITAVFILTMKICKYRLAAR